MASRSRSARARLGALGGRAVWTFLAALPLGALLVGASCEPGDPELAQAAKEARRIDFVSVVADDVYRGRDNGTAGSLAVQEVLIDALSAIGDGLDTSQTGRDAYRQPFATTTVGTNLLAVIPGSDLADEYVIVGAHYDHLGAYGSTVYNGATDNASGVAVVLAVGAAIASKPTPPRRSVVLALWDAEEDSLAGSQAYVDAPLVPLASTVAYVNLDIQGANLVPSVRDITFAVAAESGGEAMRQLVRDAGAPGDLELRLFSRVFGQDRSDHVAFLNSNVPSVFFSDADGPCYHTPGDDIDVVDRGKLREQAETALRLVLALADTDTPPAIAPPSQATYEDAVTLGEVIDRAVAADLGLFPSYAQSQILSAKDTVDAIIAAGPGAFDVFTGLQLVLAAVDVIDALSTIPCNGFVLRPAIAVAPDGEPSPIDPESTGVVPVALLGAPGFDVGDVDPTTLAFGPYGAAPADFQPIRLEDTNGDGRTDLVAEYRIRQTGIAPSTSEACVSGALQDGTRLEGCAAIDVAAP